MSSFVDTTSTKLLLEELDVPSEFCRVLKSLNVKVPFVFFSSKICHLIILNV